MIILLVIWLLLGVAGGMIMSNKGRSGCGGFALGFLLGPVGLVIALVMATDHKELEKKALQEGVRPTGTRLAEVMPSGYYKILTPGDLDGRLTGPGFDLATPQDGDPLAIGDPYVAAGLALAHAPSGFEIDLGSTLWFPHAEHVSHAGVDEAVVLHVAWRRRSASARD